MKCFCLCCSFRLVLSIPGVGSGPAACAAVERGDLGCLPPFLLKSMLAPGAAPQPRRICRRLGYWRVPTDPGESIEGTSQVGGPIFGARGAAQNSPGTQWPSGNARSIIRTRRAPWFAIFAESPRPPLSLRENRMSIVFAVQKILRWATSI